MMPLGSLLFSEENCKDPHGFNQRRKNTSHCQRAIGPSTRERGPDNLFPNEHGQANGFRDDLICYEMKDFAGRWGPGGGLKRIILWKALRDLCRFSLRVGH